MEKRNVVQAGFTPPDDLRKQAEADDAEDRAVAAFGPRRRRTPPGKERAACSPRTSRD
jgi:hypothetical protein